MYEGCGSDAEVQDHERVVGVGGDLHDADEGGCLSAECAGLFVSVGIEVREKTVHRSVQLVTNCVSEGCGTRVLILSLPQRHTDGSETTQVWATTRCNTRGVLECIAQC